MKQILTIWTIFVIVILYSCVESTEVPKDNFDRQALLIEWADRSIIPAIEDYRNSLSDMNLWMLEFEAEPSAENLQTLREAYINSYNNWQSVAVFNIGKAEELQLLNYTNIYPCDITRIEENIESSISNLALPSNYAAQGFPAIDYLLFKYSNTTDALAYLTPERTNYLSSLTMRLWDLTTELKDDWTSQFRDAFIEADGSSATASVDKMVNDYIFYLEKHIRAAKVGIPAGVFSGGLLPQNLEAYYSQTINKDLLKKAIHHHKSFYLGTHADSATSENSLATYVQFMDNKLESQNLHQKITQQYDNIEVALDKLDTSLEVSVVNDHMAMLELYDELQKLLVLFKVDLLQLLNIQVDYVDADGD